MPSEGLNAVAGRNEAAVQYHRHWLIILCSFMVWGCAGFSPPPDLLTMDPAQDQWRIAEYYSREAARLRQKSLDLYASAVLYERVFGADSDWVVGSRLLAQSYEEAAYEHERLAQKHLDLAGAHREPRSALPLSHASSDS
jgi:hypothetical protein